MQTVLLVIHLLVAIALVGTVLLQKSEGGALGMGGGGMSGFMTGRSTANLLTRTTAILAGVFFLTSVILVLMATHTGGGPSMVGQPPPISTPGAPVPPLPPATAPATAPSTPTAPSSAPAAPPVAPAEPSAPVGK